MDLLEELLSLVSALKAGGVDYAVCGGIALAIHGHPRFTKDIDVLVRPDDLKALTGVASSCGFVRSAGPVVLGKRSAIHRTLYRFTKSDGGETLSLDVLLADASLDPAWSGRQEFSIAGHRLTAVSREGLRWMKRLTGRTQDKADLEAMDLNGKEDRER